MGLAGAEFNTRWRLCTSLISPSREGRKEGKSGREANDQTGRHTDTQASRHANIHIHKKAGIHSDMQMIRQVNIQASRKAVIHSYRKQADKHTYIQAGR